MSSTTAPTIRICCAAAIAAMLLVSGCKTSSRQAPRYAWETAQEAEYKALFRNRWWNYYDRGMWSELRGDYKSAERDLLRAKSLRERDQLWPRTYGMHFLSEYFPSRELGITYYHTGRFDESVRLLEESLEQQFSARAAYFADLARTEVLKRTGGDIAAPTIAILSPAPGGFTSAVYTTLTGVARDDQFVKEIYVDGKSVDVRQSLPAVSFTAPIVLSPGDNSVQVRAVDLLGKSTEQTFHFNADHEGPSVSFDPFDQTASVLSGVAYDASGVTTLTLNGIPVTLRQRDNVWEFSTRIDSASIDAGVPFACEDTNGNHTGGRAHIDRNTGVVAMSEPARLQYAMAPGPALDRLIAKSESTDPAFRARMANIEDEQRIYQPQVVINLEVNSPAPVQEVTLDDRRIDIVPARTSFVLSTILPLGDEPAPKTIRLAALNTQGATSSDEKTIHRELSTIETEKGRLSFGWYRKVNKCPDQLSDIDMQILLSPTEIREVEQYRQRFGPFFDRDDESMEALLQEQTYAQLSNSADRLRAEEVLVPDLLLAVEVNARDDFIEIQINAMSTLTGAPVGQRVEMADQFSKDRLAEYREKLVARLVQEFPRLKRRPERISGTNGENVSVALTTLDGIKQDYNCIFVEQMAADDFVVRGQGYISGVGRLEKASAKFNYDEDFKPQSDLERYLIITK